MIDGRAASFTAATMSLILMTCGGPASRSDTLTLIAPAAPGGGWDQTARAMQQVLETTGVAPTAQVVNVPGAGGVIGLAQVVSAHEGNPSLIMITGLIMMGAISTNASPVSLDDVTPIARLLGEYEVLVVPADSPHRTLDEFVTAWRADPGGLAIAGGSAGGADHMLIGLLAKEVGVSMDDVNYVPHSGGGESLASLLGGHVAAGVNGYAELMPFIDAGRLTPLAVSSEERIEGVDIPTFPEQGINVSLANWRGLAAPPGVTAEERARLEDVVARMHASTDWQDALERNNWIDLYLAGTEYETFLEQENARVTNVLRSIGLID